MNDKKLKAFAKDLVEVAQLLKSGDDPPLTARSLSFLAGETQVNLVNEDAAAFDELNGRLYRENGWGEKYSESHLADLLRSLLGRLYPANRQEDAEQGLARIVDGYNSYSTEQVVLVPMFGAELHLAEFRVGRVRLIKPTEAGLQERLGRNCFAPPGMYVLHQLKGKVLAEYRTIAEPIRAKERAMEEARRGAELLRYMIPFVHPNQYKPLGVNVSVMGDHPDADCLSFVMPSGKDGSMTFATESKRPMVPLHLDETALTTFQTCGASDVSALLEQRLDSLTDLDRAILRGIRWFGNALCQVEAENELLSLTTCLETCLTPRDGNPIGTAIAEGVAILLGEGLAERKKLKRRVKDLYGKRSGVSHGGEKAVLGSDLVELRDIASRLVRKVICMRATASSQKALLEMIEDAKLG